MHDEFPLLRGYLPNPESAKDKDFAFDALRMYFKAQEASDPGQEFVIKHFRPLRMQVGGSCVGNAWCNALEMLSDNQKEGLVSMPELSAQGLYFIARQRHSAQASDEGTYPRAAADALVKIGVGPVSMWPDDPVRINMQPGPDWFVEAMEHRLKIEAYYNILSFGDQRAEEVELAVRAGHPVVLGIPVDRDFMNYVGEIDESTGETRVLEPAGVEELYVGRHAIVVHGVRGVGDSQQFRILNSWGQWGDRGGAWLSRGYIDVAMDLHVPVLPVAA